MRIIEFGKIPGKLTKSQIDEIEEYILETAEKTYQFNLFDKKNRTTTENDVIDFINSSKLDF